MASVYSNYVASTALAWLAGTAAPAAPASLFVEFNSTRPDADGLGGTALGSRQPVTFTAPVRSEDQGVMIANSADVVLTGASAGTLNFISIWTAATGGDLIAVVPASVPQTVSSGGTFSTAAGALRLYMGGLTSYYFGESVLNWIRGNNMPAAPAELYVAYSRANPTRDGGGLLEPSTSFAYERQPIEFGATEEVLSGGQKISNTIPAVFGPANNGTWVNVTHIVLIDSVSGAGNIFLVGQVQVPFSVGIGAGHGIATDGLVVTLK